MTAAPAESCQSLPKRSPWGRLGSVLYTCKRLHRIRRRFKHSRPNSLSRPLRFSSNKARFAFFFLSFRPYRRKQPPLSGREKSFGQVHPPSVSRRRKRPDATGHSYQGHAAACPSPPDSPRGRSALRLRTSRRRLIGLRTFSHPVTAPRGKLIGRSRDLH